MVEIPVELIMILKSYTECYSITLLDTLKEKDIESIKENMEALNEIREETHAYCLDAIAGDLAEYIKEINKVDPIKARNLMKIYNELIEHI